MLNFLELNNDYKKMYKTNLIKINGTKLTTQKHFEMGNIDINSGQNISSDNRVRLVEYISINPNSKYFIKSNIKSNMGLRFYDKDKNYIGSTYGNKSVVFNTAENCYYIRFIIETKELAFIRVIIEPLLLSQNLKIDLKFEQGSINYSTGQNQNLASTLRTDFIEVQENEKYKLRYYNSNIVYGLRCYDKDKHYLKPDEINSNIITIPSGTHYIRIIRKDLSKPDEYLERI